VLLEQQGQQDEVGLAEVVGFEGDGARRVRLAEALDPLQPEHAHVEGITPCQTPEGQLQSPCGPVVVIDQLKQPSHRSVAFIVHQGILELTKSDSCLP
jgi:hypothetical protein